VETGKSYAEAEESILTSEDKVSASGGKASAPLIIWETGDVAEIDSLSSLRDQQQIAVESLAGDSNPTCVHEQVYCQVVKWADNDPKRWQRLHNALLRIYAPTWERIDARDLLVSWTAACLALTRAKRDLKRLERLQHPLTSREIDTKGGRQADVSFWGRLAQRLSAQVPGALTEDMEATKVLVAVIGGKRGERK